MGIFFKKANLPVIAGIGIIILSLFLPWTSLGSGESANLWGYDKYGIFSLITAVVSLFFVKKEKYLVVLGLTVFILIVSFIQFINISDTLYISEPDINFSKNVISIGFYIHIFGCFLTLLTSVLLNIVNFIKNK